MSHLYKTKPSYFTLRRNYITMHKFSPKFQYTENLITPTFLNFFSELFTAKPSFLNPSKIQTHKKFHGNFAYKKPNYLLSKNLMTPTSLYLTFSTKPSTPSMLETPIEIRDKMPYKRVGYLQMRMDKNLGELKAIRDTVLSKEAYNAWKEQQVEEVTKQFERGFTPEDLGRVIKRQADAMVAYDVFRWAPKQRRYAHTWVSYKAMVEKFASKRSMDMVSMLVEEVMDGALENCEPFFNSAISIYIQARKIERAMDVYIYMRDSSHCKPTLSTYTLLLCGITASGHYNSHVMEIHLRNMASLFQQMLRANVTPDITVLNAMIKAWSYSMHMEGSLKFFHELGRYGCAPNEHTFGFMITGFCLTNQSDAALRFYRDMIDEGFVPRTIVSQSLVNCLFVNGKFNQAIAILHEMLDSRKFPQPIVYETMLRELHRKGNAKMTTQLIKDFAEKDRKFDEEACHRFLNHLRENDMSNYPETPSYKVH